MIKLGNSQLSRIAIAGTTGILMGFTTAPVGFWPLAWVALIPLWVLIHQSPATTSWRWRVIMPCLAWGIGYYGFTSSWITGIHPMTWLGVPWLPSLLITIVCWIVITLWGAGLVMLWGLGMVAHWTWFFPDVGAERNQRLKVWSRVLWGAGLWCGLEALWSSTPLWWSSLAYTQAPHQIAFPQNLAILHLGQLSGTSTITAILLAVNGLMAEAWLQSHPIRYRFPILLCLIAHILGFTLYSRPLIDLPDSGIKIGMIQGNISNDIKFNAQGWKQALEGYTTGYRNLVKEGVEAVLLPETALPYLWTAETRVYSSFYQAILEEGVPAWVGAFGVKGQRITNSLFMIDGRGKVVSRYDKIHLVPLGEYIPLENIFGKIINRLSPLEAHLTLGDPEQLFDTPWGRIIVGICYDSAYPEHFRRQAVAGGQLILIASNDAHYAPWMLAQHHAQDVMRAIETDRWTVRATNTGYSGTIDPHGHTLWRSRMNTYQRHSATIYRRTSQTLYVKWGDWLTPVLLSMSLCGMAYIKIDDLKKK